MLRWIRGQRSVTHASLGVLGSKTDPARRPSQMAGKYQEAETRSVAFSRPWVLPGGARHRARFARWPGTVPLRVSDPPHDGTRRSFPWRSPEWVEF